MSAVVVHSAFCYVRFQKLGDPDLVLTSRPTAAVINPTTLSKIAVLVRNTFDYRSLGMLTSGNTVVSVK
jgi:hypothetical protein